MRSLFLASASAVVFLAISGPAAAQDEQDDQRIAGPAAEAPGAERGDVITVTATRREQNIQDVPLSITAFGQEELTQKGIVGYEGLARETPGVVINKPTANFNNFTARGLAVNGYNANLQSTVAIYIDEVPISANGNSTIIDPNLFDVERVEFLRGPQGTLFGSGSLAGAVRILTNEPDLDEYDASALVDYGLTGSDSFRQRYNGMVNVPIARDVAALRVVGFYRDEEGWVDNIGTGIENSNDLIDWGGRAVLAIEPTDRLSISLLASYEDSDPKDSALINPDLGEETRLSDRPDRFVGVLETYNGTVEYDFGSALFTSSTSYTTFDQKFYVDLAGTFNQAIAFGLDADAYDDIFVEEARLASTGSGPFEWVAGVFYFDKRRDVDYRYRSTRDFLAARGLTGLPDEYYQKQGSHTLIEEFAGFGELTYRFADNFWVTGGLRYGSTEVQSFTEAGGYTSNYLTAALTGYSGPLTITEVLPAEGVKAEEDGFSYKASVSYQPVPEITTYATYATGFRTPVRNAFAGRVSLVDPDDIVIPEGASSDDLDSYEIGLKGTWLDGMLSTNLAAYYIDWSNIQVQANRVSDSVQFATNIGAARSQGLEFEIGLYPSDNLSLGVSGSFNDAEVTELTPTEAAISGAVEGARLASPEFQGSAYGRYNFELPGQANGFLAANVQRVGAFPGLFPNVAGNPDQQNPTYAYTEAYWNVDATVGANIGEVTVSAYVENLLDDHSITYVHPEAFLANRFGTLRPRTVGIRLSYGI